LEQIDNGTAKRTPQDESKATYYPVLKKRTAEIDFTKTSVQVCNSHPRGEPVAGRVYIM
jgi:methionyl-tRNA formyltransferase